MNELPKVPGLTPNPVQGKFYHGSPYEGLKSDLTNWAARTPMYVTPQRDLAAYYANGGSSAFFGFDRPAEAESKKPSLYEIQVNAANVFDSRKPEHREWYEQARQEYNKNDPLGQILPLPPVSYESTFSQQDMLPFGEAIPHLAPFLTKRGFTAAWGTERSSHVSLELFDTNKGVHRVEKIEHPTVGDRVQAEVESSTAAPAVAHHVPGPEPMHGATAVIHQYTRHDGSVVHRHTRKAK